MSLSTEYPHPPSLVFLPELGSAGRRTFFKIRVGDVLSGSRHSYPPNAVAAPLDLDRAAGRPDFISSTDPPTVFCRLPGDGFFNPIIRLL